MGGIIGLLVKNVVIPELLAAIKRIRDRKGGIEPTEAEVMAELDANIDAGIARGKAFLAATTPANPVP